jgi:2-dehydro-3-deoxy-L-rhamnonate dehydrogenase (NAD+)
MQTVKYNFSGKTVLITGGTRGIGLEITNKMRLQGAVVHTWGHNVDVRNTAAIKDAIEKIGEVQILVNCAGVFGPVKSTLEYTDEEWNDVLNVNLTGQFRVCRAVIPGMVTRGYGRVVNMSSIVAKDVNPMAPAYSVAKAGVVALTKCLGRELAKTGVVVNCVTPAACDTGLFDNVPSEQVKAMLAKTAINRFVTVEEIAALVCWLASDECTASNGATFDISGGRAQY